MNQLRRTILITGASSGLGLACARVLSDLGGHHLLLGVRDSTKGERARRALSHPDAAELVTLDLAALGSVRAAADDLARRGPIDAIVCNAGVHESGPPTFTVDGLETTFAVNHVAHQLLVTRLLPSMREGGRIVVVSSGTHDPATLEGRHNPPGVIDVRALARGESEGRVLPAVRRYTSSKLCNLLFSLELERRLASRGDRGRRITVNAYDPGAVPGTELTRGWGPAMRLLVRSSWLLRALGVAVSTPERAGAAMARLVTDDALEHVSGRYFQLEKERAPSVQARDAALARRLFDQTAQLLGEPSVV